MGNSGREARLTVAHPCSMRCQPAARATLKLACSEPHGCRAFKVCNRVAGLARRSGDLRAQPFLFALACRSVHVWPTRGAELLLVCCLEWFYSAIVWHYVHTAWQSPGVQLVEPGVFVVVCLCLFVSVL